MSMRLAPKTYLSRKGSCSFWISSCRRRIGLVGNGGSGSRTLGCANPYKSAGSSEGKKVRQKMNGCRSPRLFLISDEVRTKNKNSHGFGSSSRFRNGHDDRVSSFILTYPSTNLRRKFQLTLNDIPHS